MSGYVKMLENEIEHRSKLIELLENGQTFYEVQNDDAMVVANVSYYLGNIFPDDTPSSCLLEILLIEICKSRILVTFICFFDLLTCSISCWFSWVWQAYRNFGIRINNLKKRLIEYKETLDDGGNSPIPSPSADAPSPGNTPPPDSTADQVEEMDMELSDTEDAAGMPAKAMS